MTDTAVRLRKVAHADLDEFERAFQSRDGASANQWFGFWDSVGTRTALEERQLLAGDGHMLAVTLGDDLVGRVEWMRRSWGRADTSSCWEIGVGIFPGRRGSGIGTEAQRLLVDYLFTHYPVQRVQATTAAENTAEQRCLEKIGFTREGVIRQAQWRDGAWHDQWIYAILRSEWNVTHES